MKLVGYRRSNFRTKDEKEITGFSIFLENEIDSKRGAGVECERLYLSDVRIKSEGIDLAAMLGKRVNVFYTRYGKLASIAPVE